jgi:nitroreductase
MEATLQPVLDTLSAIEQRRSVKHYDPEFVMPEADEKRLLSVALLSPTSFNIQNWRFVVVKNPELRQHIQAAAWGQAQVTEASLLVVLCANLQSFNEDPQRYWRNAPQAVQDMIVPMIVKSYEGNDQLQRDEALRSIGIASQTLMLAAKSMGYDSCPMVGFDPAKVAELIKLPANHVVGLLLSIGKAKTPARERSGQLAYADVVKTDTF